MMNMADNARSFDVASIMLSSQSVFAATFGSSSLNGGAETRSSATRSWEGAVHQLVIGDQVEDLSFLRLDGAVARLSDFPGPLLLIFLRHLR